MSDLELELKKLIVTSLNLEDIEPEAIGSEETLFGDGLGLDSIDGLELGMAIRKSYGIKIEAKKDELRRIFLNVRNLAQFVASQRGAVSW